MTDYLGPDLTRRRHKARAKKVRAKGAFDLYDLGERLNSQNFSCHYCQGQLYLQGPEKYQPDHFIPLSKGGSNHASNIVCACPGCNKDKGSKMPWEFRPARFEEGCGRDG